MIKIQHLTKRFGTVTVLSDITADLPTGKATVILGGSGHGKTVLLKTLCALYPADGGRIQFAETEVTALGQAGLYRFWSRIGYLFQDNALIDSLTVEENLSLSLKYLNHFDPTEIRSRIESLLQYVDLAGIGPKMPEELSWGMKKRVALARALAKDPDYLILDEPTSGIDRTTWTLVTDMLASYLRQHRTTAIIATHDISLMEKLAERVLFLHSGRITYSGDKEGISRSLLDQMYNEARHAQ